MIPRASIWSLRSALVWFVVGTSIGGLLLVDKGVGTLGLAAGWLHAHLHIMFAGWLLQTIFAVAYWMLPRFGRKRPRSRFAITAIGALNVASVAAIGFVWIPVHRLVALLELAAVVLFVWHAWPRVKAFGTPSDG